MSVWFALTILIVITVTFFHETADTQGVYPCHAGRDTLGVEGCSSVSLPKELCLSCPLKDVIQSGDNAGDFANCRSIYNIDSVECMGALKDYAALNPCDWRRAEQVYQLLTSENDWVKAQAKEKLDYFIYSICEQCCDCIPQSSKYSNYEDIAHNVSNLYTHTRGNCAAHAYYDVSRIPQSNTVLTAFHFLY